MSATVSRKQAIGTALLLFGAVSFAIMLYQLNAYLGYSSLSDYARAASLKNYEQLKNDPAQLASLGLTAAELEQMGPTLLAQIDTNVQAVSQQASVLVLPMLLDFVLALVLCGAGIHLVEGK